MKNRFDDKKEFRIESAIRGFNRFELSGIGLNSSRLKPILFEKRQNSFSSFSRQNGVSKRTTKELLRHEIRYEQNSDQKVMIKN